MNKQMIMGLMAQALIALGDEVITADELVTMFNLFIRSSGLDLKGEFYELFIEQDGDAHVIIKRSLLDKLKIAI